MTIKDVTKSKAKRDFFLILTIAVVVSILSISLNLFDLLFGWMEDYEYLEFDDIFVVIFFLFLALMVLSVLRLKELKERTAKIEELEEHKNEMEKLAATGRLAAGIAHEINNPLAGIKNCFSLVKSCVESSHKYFEYVLLIEKEIERISNIVKGMNQLQYPVNQVAVSVNIEKVLRDINLMLIKEIEKNGLMLEFEIEKPLPELMLLEAGLRQILYNLVLNSLQASAPGGKVVVAACFKDKKLYITVKDYGAGISTQVLPIIFDPFFSTKKKQETRGMGLGLSVSRSLAKAMSGEILVRSDPGQETAFTLILPGG